MTTSSESPTMEPNFYPLITQLADVIVQSWQQHLDLDPFELPEGLGYIEGKLDDERLMIRNTCYQSKHFRKMHLEMAKVGTNLDILHCVMFPHSEYALPMFGCDIVATPKGISAAIADLSPTNATQTLDPVYEERLLEGHKKLNFSQPRVLPEWGAIFSKYCIFIRPSSPDEEQLFVSRVQAFLDIHCQIALESQPLPAEQQQIHLAGQQNYCAEQQKNDKTRRILEKAFDAEWAELYFSQVLFDIPA
ncbi:MAG: phycocyanobilin:ferredoxin oxidoreductase [Limnothrix sp. RL_2_0]|nr:phycocyanobilin:ferredoxin oxidoreductase [Limnothrix sp. RL_2_0]